MRKTIGRAALTIATASMIAVAVPGPAQAAWLVRWGGAYGTSAECEHMRATHAAQDPSLRVADSCFYYYPAGPAGGAPGWWYGYLISNE